MTIEFSIIAPAAGNVQSGVKKKHKRIKRDCIAAKDVNSSVKAWSRHIVKTHRKGQRVHIPALKGNELGQLLRALEIKRAYA
ncbi:hypothetical protein QMZ62_24270 [Serratia sp. PF2-63]|uniref:hypothetical protein n=1 Tax=unclassified Serratia (in: enterobacteria) TaxID=2647522 RepID=UPI0024B54B67|nr:MULTISPECIES: hypothetical protein [unclassified Serratia (in: enterobacteria)]MDI9266066.1 hypothetical protein [Serratia sp. PF2-63]MDI9266407.1 hypothetical protein [Serratia sp. PF-27]